MKKKRLQNIPTQNNFINENLCSSDRVRTGKEEKLNEGRIGGGDHVRNLGILSLTLETFSGRSEQSM